MFKLHRVAYTLLAAALVMPTAQARDEITVTAQRRDASLQDVPISVTAISAEEIEKLQINFVADIAKNVPNLQTYTVTAGAAAMQVFMRGAGVQNPGFNASEAPVGIYIDDVYRGRVGTANLELADVERIEVLRGPQGTLYGRNTIAGAIKVITRTPGEESYTNASVGYDNYSTLKTTAAVGGEVADGLGMSVAALYNKRDEGWITRAPVNAPNVDASRELGEYDNKAIRTKLNYFGDDTFSALATLEYIDAENDGYNAIPYSGGEPVAGFYRTLVPNGNVGVGATKQGNGTLDLSWQLGDTTLRSISSYSKIKDRFVFDLNGGVVNPPLLESVLIDSLAENRTWTQEITLSGATDSFDWITGIFFMKERGSQDYRANAAPFINLLEASRTDTQSYALFGEGTWQIKDNMSLTAGARWTLDDKEYENVCTGGSCGGTWTNELGKNFNEFTPRLLVQWEHSDQVSTFAGVSRGFQSGGFQTLCFGNQACNQVIYDPQTVVSWETGMKLKLLDDTMRYNMSFFHAQYSGLQQTSIGPVGLAGPSFPVQNVGSVDVSGIELEIDWAPVDGLNLFATLGLADESFGSGVTGAGNALPTTDRLPGLPRRTIRLGGDYTMTAPYLPSEWGLDLVIGGDMNYASDYYATINNVLTIDSYTRFNARVGLEQQDGPWSVFASGTNITDEKDLYSGILGGGTDIRTPQPPRMFMLTVNYRK
ncbi:MAG: TonB-dependent receptor [Gammaproteobacteria bacterium]|nr:TonB-dependent receptor [Gammaproteobacteria bacterium]NND54033.1 TonB-dependent receptor [Gammaproteobacteria bacterium]